MASAQNQAPNADLFDAYFRRADLDRDGRISGSEAVSFFQGSGLSKQVLAQVWAIANQSQTGFLGRAEFYNALKLVTVAQSKRDLTPEMVKAALYGPASAKIPAPQINFTAMAAPQFNSSVAAPTPQVGAVPPMSSPNLGFRGPQVPPNAGLNQQHFPSQGSQLMRPPQVLPGGGTLTGPRPPNSSISSDWVGGRTGAALPGTSSQVVASGIDPPTTHDEFGLATSGSTAALPPRPQATSGMKPSGPPAKDSKALNISGNGFAPDSIFGGDAFSATPSQPKQDSSAHTISAGNSWVSATVVPVSAGTQPPVRPSAFDSLQSSLTMQPVGGQLQQVQPRENQNQKLSPQTTSASSSSGISLGTENSASSQSQPAWPRMTQTDVQKYAKVFVEVDKDRDGRITGEEARNLFLSWRLPREVLKQVWDLSDQDNDSMLSLREFCVALYLMERYRDGRPLPAVLPSNIMFDLSTPGQPMTNYTNAAWQPPSGFQQQQAMPSSGARHITTAVAARPPRPVAVPQAEGSQANVQKSKVPVLEKHLVNQLSSEEQNSLNSKFQEATEADKKVEELEKEMLESRQKIEFYRVKMQEIVLYKSRCDNRLNEITERTSADKREVESLAKKYEEKYKQVGDVASKLTIEEATFRDLQEKKMELYQAIVKMEQDGTADGVLQVCADHIQSDLDNLVKSLNERCKKYGLHAKPTTLTELPFGWQTGIQEGAADWDEDWDKFEDEGFTSVKELTLDVQNVIAPPREKFKSARDEKASTIESPTTAASPNADMKSEKPQIMDEQAVVNGSAYNKSEDDSAKSAPNSPAARSAIESPPREFPDFNFDKAIGADASPRDKDYQSDHGGAGSVFFGDKSFDEPTWGRFDNNDDVDSVWGLNPVSTSKGTDQERNGENYFFGSGEFGLNPIRTESPQAGGFFQKKSAFSFDDSVPSTPLFSSSNSPHKYEGSGPSFDSFSRFDSFSTHDTGFFAPRETLARFDSVRSSGDYDQGHGFQSFDDTDPFGSGPFRTSLESQTPRRTSDNWSAF